MITVYPPKELLTAVNLMDIIYADWDFETVNWGYILISFTVKTLKLEKKKKKFIIVGD